MKTEIERKKMVKAIELACSSGVNLKPRQSMSSFLFSLILKKYENYFEKQGITKKDDSASILLNPNYGSATYSTFCVSISSSISTSKGGGYKLNESVYV